MDEALIAGIDPGNTSAVAALDLEGELKLLESAREFPPEEIIMALIETGRPVVIGCDTQDMPSTVEKIASNLGAKKFKPNEDLKSKRKQSLADRGGNSHEKDAIASARYAYNNLRRKISKIERISEEEDIDRSSTARRYFSEGREKDLKNLNS